MLGLTPAVRIFVCTKPADMRRSFDGLASMASELVGEDPLSGHLFLFRNRRRDRIKILYWDTDGLCIWYKRLEMGVFQLPSDRADVAVAKTSTGELEEKGLARWEIRVDELAMLLGGIDLTSARRRKRYQRPAG
jgi:transposase